MNARKTIHTFTANSQSPSRLSSEAWRRAEAGELSDEELYPGDAQWAGIYDWMCEREDDDIDRRPRDCGIIEPRKQARRGRELLNVEFRWPPIPSARDLRGSGSPLKGGWES